MAARMNVVGAAENRQTVNRPQSRVREAGLSFKWIAEDRHTEADFQRSIRFDFFVVDSAGRRS